MILLIHKSFCMDRYIYCAFVESDSPEKIVYYSLWLGYVHYAFTKKNL